MQDYFNLPVTDEEEEYYHYLVKQIEYSRKLKEEIVKKEEPNGVFESST